ncbi:MAG: type II toxin-antitoxin system RelE/ParE family toxin [Luteibaculum sp.]
MTKRFETILLKDAFEFIHQQDLKVRKKIFQNIRRAEYQTNSKFFKKLGKDIWEFRTIYAGIQYRLLAFWDKDDQMQTLVVATHGFVKKTSKIDKKEIEKTTKIKSDYQKNKTR